MDLTISVSAVRKLLRKRDHRREKASQELFLFLKTNSGEFAGIFFGVDFD